MADSASLPMDPASLDLATQLLPYQTQAQVLGSLLTNSMAPQQTQMLGSIAVRQPLLGALARVLTGRVAQGGLGDVFAGERGVVQQRQQQASQALGNLMQSTVPQGGTPTTVQEEAGPPDAQGNLSYSVHPGQAPTLDPSAFGRAYEAARFSGVDPNILNGAAGQFQLGRVLMQMGYGNMVPGMPGGAPSVTPGDANHGAILSMPPGAGGQPQGGASGMPPGIGAAMPWMLAGAYSPQIGKIGDAIVNYMKPTSVRPGGTVTVGGQPVFSAPDATGQFVWNNGQPSYRTIPGQIPAEASKAGAVAQATAGATAPYKVQMFTMADGSMKPGYADGQGHIVFLAPGAGTQPPPASGAPAGGAPAAPGNFGFPASAGAVPSPYAPPGAQGAILQDEYAKVLAQPDSPYRTQNLNALTTEMQRAGVVPQGTSAAPPQSPGAQAFGQTTQQKAFQEAQGTVASGQFKDIDDKAANAQQQLASAREMEDALTAFNPGAGAEAFQALGSVAARLGLPDDIQRKFAAGDLSASQIFQKLAFQNSLQNLRANLGPGQQIRQLEMLKNFEYSPNATLQRQALTTLLQTQTGLARWQLDMQAAKNAWQGDPTKFLGWWNQNHPLTGNDAQGQPYIPTYSQVKGLGASGAPAQVSIDRLRANPGEASLFDQRYGPGSAARILGNAAQVPQ